MSDHNPIYHLKDAYFFEVPKALWRRSWQSLDEVPAFLRAPYDSDHLPSVAEFNEAMSGKVLIPQPFGQLDSLYAMKSGIGISKYMLLELAVGGAILLLFAWLAKRIASGAPAKGRLANLLEAMLVFVRDQIARPAIDDKHAHADEHGHVHHDGDKFVPLLWTLFFFILGCNLLGMVPWAGSPTASFSVTLAMAAATFLAGFVGGVKAMGLAGYFKNLVPPIDMPASLFPLKIVISLGLFLIELLGLVIKHLVLAVRLLANMVAGHMVLLGIMALIPGAAALSLGMWGTATGISVVSATLFSVLELFVAFLQAYIFTFLSALFIGASVHHH
ncbi:MAG: F0F1 ATP synthase subunit A [Planctomycetia bacterium]